MALSGETFKAGFGYLDNGSLESNNGFYGGSQMIAYGSTEFGNVSLKGYISRFEDGALNLDRSYGLSIDYQAEAVEFTAFARRDDLFDAQSGKDAWDSIGVGVSYDLGGGASILGGVVDTDEIDGGETIADFGINVAF